METPAAGRPLRQMAKKMATFIVLLAVLLSSPAFGAESLDDLGSFGVAVRRGPAAVALWVSLHALDGPVELTVTDPARPCFPTRRRQAGSATLSGGWHGRWWSW